jgi:hypothetical protein
VANGGTAHAAFSSAARADSSGGTLAAIRCDVAAAQRERSAQRHNWQIDEGALELR